MKQDHPPREQVQDDIQLLNYIIILSKNSRRIIYTSLLLPIAVYLILLLFFPLWYTATARIVPPTQNLTLSAQLMDGLLGTIVPGKATALGGMMGDVLGLKSPADLYVGILTSDTVFDRIIERFELRKLYKEKYIEETRKRLGKLADIRTARDGLISISVTDKSRQRAADMANAFVEELALILRRQSEEEARARLAFLDEKLKEASLNLATAEENLKKFSEKTGVLQIDAQTMGSLQYLAYLRAMLDAKEVELKLLQHQLTPSNHFVILAEKERTALKNKIREVEQREGMEGETSEALIATTRIPSLGLEYLRLFREVRFQDAVYRVYLKLAELARVDLAREPLVIQVVDRAKVPEQKSHPKRLLITLVVFFVTLVVMILASFAREYWQQRTTTETAGQVEQIRAHFRWLREDFRRLSWRRSRE